jgi:hypothetical protein
VVFLVYHNLTKLFFSPWLCICASIPFYSITRPQTIIKVSDITGADFSDMLLNQFQITTLCKTAGGTNPKTGVDTRESLMCE